MPRSNTIQRFEKAEVRLHWAIAAPFLVCYLSALVLFVFSIFPAAPYRAVFAWIHRISGVCFIVLPLLVVASSPGSWKLFLYNIKEAWIWALDDLKWLLRSGMAALHRDVSLPEQGKFNAGEKLNFMMVTATYFVFIVTGMMIWMPGVSFYAWLVHFVMALIATPFLIGHIYMATINPSTREGLSGMVSGRVDREWARHHYALWYREFFGEDEDADLEGQRNDEDFRGAARRAPTEADPSSGAVEVEAVLVEECLEEKPGRVVRTAPAASDLASYAVEVEAVLAECLSVEAGRRRLTRERD